MDDGPWWASPSRPEVASDDFTRDVVLRVTGDFADFDERLAYCEWLAKTLNDAGRVVVTHAEWDALVTQRDSLRSRLAAIETNLGPRKPDNDMVICPNCTCQFIAIPVNVQSRLAAVEGLLREAQGQLRDQKAGSTLDDRIDAHLAGKEGT